MTPTHPGRSTIRNGLPPAYAELPSALGRYQIVSLLGAGGFGRVYLAHDPQLERQVAVKVSNREWLSTSDAVQHFVAEARRAADLNHPGMVAVYDVARDDQGRVYIVMEYVEGSTLKEMLAERKPSHAEAARIVAWVADALQYAHSSGFVHRDLKPSNILIDEQQRPHLSDFGLALHEDEEHGHMGEVSGSPPYMSPEQVRGQSHHLDGRSDIWSLGVILYEMLTGRRPFRGKNIEGLFDEIRDREPKPPRQIDPSIPKPLQNICLKCLQKSVTDRYAAAVDVADDLWRWLRKAGLQGDCIEWQRPVEARQRILSARLDAGRFGCGIALMATLLLMCVASFGLWSTATAYREALALRAKEPSRGHRDLERERLLAAAAERNLAEAMERARVAARAAEMERMVAEAAPTRGTITVASSPDGRRFAFANDESVRVWDVSDTSRATNLLAHEAQIRQIVFSDDSKFLAAGGETGKIVIWNLKSPNAPSVEREMPEGDGAIRALGFSPDGRFAAVRSDRVVVWEPESMSQAASYPLDPAPGTVKALSFSPDGAQITVLGETNGETRRWRIRHPAHAPSETAP